MTVPDFETKRIDASIMGSRLANLLLFLEENYSQGTYSRNIVQILQEQVVSLKNVFFGIKKIEFTNARKVENEVLITYRVWLEQNSAKVKKSKSGVSLY